MITINTKQLNQFTRAAVTLELDELQLEGIIAQGWDNETQLVSMTIAEAKALRDWLIEVLPNDN